MGSERHHMITDEERKVATEFLQAQGLSTEKIEQIITILEEAKAIKQRNDENNSWVSGEELRRLLIERYGEKYRIQ